MEGRWGTRWSTVGTSAHLEKLALDRSRTAGPWQQEGRQVCWWSLSALLFSQNRKRKVSGKRVMLVVGRCGMFEDRKKGRNGNLEELPSDQIRRMC